MTEEDFEAMSERLNCPVCCGSGHVDDIESPGIRAFAVERDRQTQEKGYDAEHDKQHNAKELIAAAACYALTPENGELINWWPWSVDAWKPTTQKRNLEKAGALLAAAYDLMEARARLAELEEKRNV